MNGGVELNYLVEIDCGTNKQLIWPQGKTWGILNYLLANYNFFQ